VIVTAQPIARSGIDRRMEVTRISSSANAAGERFIHCTVRNVGANSAYYAVWLGGVKP
jgi:hypothetical protein